VPSRNSSRPSRQAAHPPVHQSIKPSTQNSIYQLARHFGIQSSYIDTAGKRQHAAPETLAAILELWGITARTPSEFRDALAECELNRWQSILEPVAVTWDEVTADSRRPSAFSLTPRFSGVDKRAKTNINCFNSFPIALRIPAAIENQLAECRLHLEGDQKKTFTARFNSLRTVKRSRISGVAFIAKELLLPALPYGYHQLEIEAGSSTSNALIISAPTKSFTPEVFANRVGRGASTAPQKSWGAFLPMYAAHSRESWGAGNFGDWQKLTDWIASLGGRVVSTLPLLAAFLDRPVCEPSPYSPTSRLFWNEFYLDIPAIPEFSSCQSAQKLVRSVSFQQQLDCFRRSSLVDYRAEMTVRRSVLEKLARYFFESDSPRRKQLSHFLRERPQVGDYARFRAACDQTDLPWQQWPQRMRDGNLRTSDYLQGTKEYHLYTQWLAHEQITALTKRCRARGVQFYLDLPLGVHPAGYDLWRERDAFATGGNVGAPPDAFFSKGQDWGFTPLHPRRLREQGYRYLREVLQFQMQHTGMLRLDHVMSLHRLYWIPQGHSAREGAYVTYPAEELYAILSLESHRHKTVLVGENLGTVPKEVNEAMSRHGLRQMYVVQFAQRANPRAALAKPPPHSVASPNTHDMPTFAAHWRGLDIDDRATLGLLTKAEVGKEHARRAKLNLALAKFLQRKGWLKTIENSCSRGNEARIFGKTGDTVRDLSLVTSAATKKGNNPSQILRGCLSWLRSSPAELVLVNLEDFWEEEKPQNVPGTSTERPNWRRKARLSIEEILRTAEFRDVLRTLGSSAYTK
jgi:4-alpha-glucanotransferase